MKKIAFSLAVLATLGLAACGGNKEAAEDTAAVVEEVAVEEVVPESAAAESAVVESAAPAAEVAEAPAQ